MWVKPRAVEPFEVEGMSTVSLVRSSAAGWGERDLSLDRAPEAAGPDHLPGPVSIAVASEDLKTGGRVVVFGSARSFVTGDTALLASTAAWLTGRTKLLGVGAKTPEQLRLVLTAAQEERVFWLCVLGLPAAAALGGALRFLRRRRA